MDTAFQGSNFSTWDWVIVGFYIVATVFIGVLVNRYIKELKHFIVAGRRIRIYLAIATLTGTELGLVTVMYNAQEGFQRGLSALHLAVMEFLAVLVIGVTGFIVYRLRQTGVMTIPEYYGKRYGDGIRWFGGLVLAIAGILNMGLFLQAGAFFIVGVTGLGTGTALTIVMAVMLGAVLLYTSLGGMVSVVVTDYLQFVVLAVGVGIASFYALSAVGWGQMFTTIGALPNATEMVNPLANKDYGITYVIWMAIALTSWAALWMTGTMRALAAKDPQTAKRMYFWTSIGYMARRAFPMLWGIAALAFVVSLPELNDVFFPAGGEGLNKMYGMPIFLGRVVPAGLLGILVAGMLAAFMSTHDSYLLGWSSVLTHDITRVLSRKIKGTDLPDRTALILTRVFVVVIGIFLFVWSFYYRTLVTLWDYMAITGTIYIGGALPAIAGGLYWRRASTVGAGLAIFFGLIACLALVPSLIEYKNIIPLVTVVGGWVVFIGGSLLFPDKQPREVKMEAS